MKKKILPLILTALMLFGLVSTAFAADVDEQAAVPTYTHLDVGVDGTVTVVTKVNGQETARQEVAVTISNVSATVDGYPVNNFYKITNPDGTQQWRSDLIWLDPNINTADVSCTVTAVVNGQEISVPYTQHLNHVALWHALYACPLHTGYDIGINAGELDDLRDSITADVGFFTEEGGTIGGGTDPILYEDLLVNGAFPEIPATEADTYYEFAGWYPADAEGNATSDVAVTTFPETVSAGTTYYVAKWNKVATPITPVDPAAAAYQVEYYLQQADGSYKLADSTTATAKLGATVTADVKSYDGYTYNEKISTVSGEVVMPVANDNGGVDMLTLKLYYDLDQKDKPTDPSKPSDGKDDNGGNQPGTTPSDGKNNTNNGANGANGTNAADKGKTNANGTTSVAQNTATSPKTADSSLLYASIALFAAAAAGMIVLVTKRRKNAQ